MTSALIPRWRILRQVLTAQSASPPTLVSYASGFRYKKRRKTTRTMHTVLIPRGRILHHFWDTQMVTVSALLDLCLFTPLFLPWKLFLKKKFRPGFRPDFWQHWIGTLPENRSSILEKQKINEKKKHNIIKHHQHKTTQITSLDTFERS